MVSEYPSLEPVPKANRARKWSAAALALLTLMACGSDAPLDPDLSIRDAAQDPGDAAAQAPGDAAAQDASGSDDPDTGHSGACTGSAGTFAVTSVSGMVEDGAEVTICGDRFGDLGPTILLFDDMERGRSGQPLAADDPPIGAWTSPAGQYVDDASRSGAMAMLLTDTELTEGSGVSAVVGLPDESGRHGLRHFDEVFLHLSIRDLGDFPGNDSSPTSFSSDSSAKDVWMMLGPRGDNYDYSCRTECNGHDLVFATHTGGGAFKTDGNNTRSSWWLPGFWRFQSWNTMSTHLRLDPDAPYTASHGVFEHVSTDGYTRDEYSGQILQELAGLPPVWDRLKVAPGTGALAPCGESSTTSTSPSVRGPPRAWRS